MTAADNGQSLRDLLAAAADQQSHVPLSGIASPEQFFEDYLSDLFKRDLSSHSVNRWCLKWGEHFEARVVIDALWRSWEVLRLDEEMGMATWMRDFAYPLMGRLFSPDGTFSGCNMQMTEGHDSIGITALNHPLD